MVITLRDGTVADTNDITFNSSSYHFYWDSGAGGLVDVTSTLTRAQKIASWPSFDITKDNLRLYNESKGGAGPIAPLPTGTASIFMNQLYSDPLSAPIEQAGEVLNKAGKAAASQLTKGGVDFLLIAGAIGLAAYIFWPVIMSKGGR